MQLDLDTLYGIFFLVLLLLSLPVVYHFGKALYLVARIASYNAERWAESTFKKNAR